MANLNDISVDGQGSAVSVQNDAYRSITPAELAGANAGQRPDLTLFRNVFYRLTTTGAIYRSTGSSLELASQGVSSGLVSQATITGITYNGSDQVTGYLRNGEAHTVSYPNATTIVDEGGGRTITITLDGVGRITNVDVV